MSKALKLSAENFKNEVIESNIPVLVDFWAPWCGPCQMMGPILDELAGELEGKIKIAKLNVDEPANQQIAAEHRIMSIPNMKLFKNGKVVHEIIGSQPKESLKKEIEENI